MLVPTIPRQDLLPLLSIMINILHIIEIIQHVYKRIENVDVIAR